MSLVSGPFEVIHDDDVIIMIPDSDLRELDFAAAVQAASRVFDLLEKKHAQHVVLDLSNTDYYGSTALGFFVKLRKRVAEQGGQFAMCNISQHELQVLKISKLDKLWPICDSREAAIEAVRSTEN